MKSVKLATMIGTLAMVPQSATALPQQEDAFAIVNNTASHDISVIALPERRVIARIPTPEIPIVMAVHPDGETLWVSSEGEDRLTVFAIPKDPRAPSRNEIPAVRVRVQ